MAKEYEYRGLVAQAWDLLCGDYSTWPDRPFYRSIIERQAGAALDVGCGTGRLLLDYLAAGLDVDGVDNSPEMLAICREKAAALGVNIGTRLFEQAMQEMDLPGRYATIFVPSSSFQLLTGERDADEAMRRFVAHLAPDGILVMSIMSKLWPGKALPPQMVWTEWANMGEAQRPDGRSTVRRWARARYDHEQQLEHEENRYEVVVNGKIVATESYGRSPAVRWYSQSQIEGIVTRAGLRRVRVTRGFTDEAASSSDTVFCVRGTRVAGASAG